MDKKLIVVAIVSICAATGFTLSPSAIYFLNSLAAYYQSSTP